MKGVVCPPLLGISHHAAELELSDIKRRKEGRAVIVPLPLDPISSTMVQESGELYYADNLGTLLLTRS